MVGAAGATSCSEGPQPAVASYGGLARYLTGLNAAQQKDVYDKLKAEGYAEPGYEDYVDGLTDAKLKEFGTQPGAVRSLLLQAFALCGPSKTVKLVDEEGNEEEWEFKSKREFELWALTNTLKLSLDTGHKRYIKTWEQLQDGGTYMTTKSLEVTEFESCLKAQDKVLIHKVAEKALADMLVRHPEATRLVCGRFGLLRNKRLGTIRQIDEVIVTHNCIEVLEVNQVVDLDAADQLGTAIEYIKQGVADRLEEFNFAVRSDGSPKEIRGALGGALLVPTQEDQQEVLKRIEQQNWGLHVVGAGRIGHGTS